MSPSNCLVSAVRALRPNAAKSLNLQTSARRTASSSSTRQLITHQSALSATQRYACASQCWANGLGRQSRTFSNSTSRMKLKTVEQIKARNKGGPFNVTAALLFVATAGGLYAYFTYEKERVARKRIAEQTKGIGKPKVGGPFDLVDHNGNRFTNEDMAGKYALVYFGFSHCPDICPDELDKMALMYDKVVEKCGPVLLPIMITCDPARDSPAVLKEYLKEFHPEIIGLTGSYDAIKDTCKAYRVYFSTPPNVKEGQDYLVDHSIYFYLMDPEGDFVEAIGRNFTADQAAKVISDHIKDWEGPLKKKDRWA
ncbi:mitochondrial metallochaperone Sco1 [Sporormia fimetaria CBS 119925]|uniref:Mitochondrial metallochaperone Sco1 n=1 Tax=Sporormia fimetaria CBS 119925 TaxID=1340428 RepID=A0A6A6VQ83_9PLEO|nr:mitochondrial metallochaperone Sco1 [Sporormia fimetaria CBS 119925]